MKSDIRWRTRIAAAYRETENFGHGGGEGSVQVCYAATVSGCVWALPMPGGLLCSDALKFGIYREFDSGNP